MDVPRQTIERLDFRNGVDLAPWRVDHIFYRSGWDLPLENLFRNKTTPLHYRKANLCKKTKLTY